MGSVATTEMSEQRALLTDTERKILSGEKEVKDNYRYSVESRVRTRLRERFGDDVELLREHQLGMFNILKKTVDEVSEEENIAESDSSEAVGEPITNDGQTDVDAKREAYEELESEQDSTEKDTDSTDVDTRVQGIVDDVAAGWDDDDRLQHRKQAAAEVLQHAVETGDAVGKSSDIVQQVREKYPVAGQNEETYWRKNIRDVLSEVGTYSRGSHKYTVTDLDQEGEADE